ncbi:MAG: DUF111 family protein, partial [Clostridiales Family XIII bacterium]|nr:DUF111 family protein [Clostridiales Family XIII bacterium]
MRTAKKAVYFDPKDGISGDMVLGALIDIGADTDRIARELDKIIPGEYSVRADIRERRGVRGVNLKVVVHDG